MTSLKSAFDRARTVDWGLSPLATMFWMVAIDEDRQQREREQTRRKRQALDTRPPNKPAHRAGPRPF
jgi:hypothetical protein